MSIISNCTASVIKDAASALISGNLVAFPTETVYGLGANATNEDAIAKIYQVKGRPTDHPLIVHISSIENVDRWARDIPEYAIQLARSFWPGPMTLILPRTDLAKDFITGGQASVGLRVPSHPVALKLLTEFEKLGGTGVAAPSANKFGAVSPTTAKAVNDEIGVNLSIKDFILDGGTCSIGIESTIIDCTDSKPKIIRPGSITTFSIQKILNLKNVKIVEKSQIRAPGNLEKHYSPKAEVLINAIPKDGDGLIALSEFKTPKNVIRLANPNNSEQYAQELYSALRKGDTKKIRRIIVIPPDGLGLEVAINDRLIKASTKIPDWDQH
jgi:L-threonylcarbamoyladenylate synthase